MVVTRNLDGLSLRQLTMLSLICAGDVACCSSLSKATGAVYYVLAPHRHGVTAVTAGSGACSWTVVTCDFGLQDSEKAHSHQWKDACGISSTVHCSSQDQNCNAHSILLT